MPSKKIAYLRKIESEIVTACFLSGGCMSGWRGLKGCIQYPVFLFYLDSPNLNCIFRITGRGGRSAKNNNFLNACIPGAVYASWEPFRRYANPSHN